MIIDSHTHCFPDTLAPRAISSLKQGSTLINYTDGTLSDLLSKMKFWNVDKAIICNIATNAKQMHNVNSFAIEINGTDGKIISLGSINPAASDEDIESEFKRLKDAKIKGIKIHPDFQKTLIEDESYNRIFDLAIKNNMYVVTHAGLDRVSPDKIHATPDGILKVIEKFPKLKLVAAHMGSKENWDEAEAKLMGKNIFVDTAVIFANGIGKERAERMIKKHGADKVLFGSDCPWSMAVREYEFIKSLDLSIEEKELILHKNAERLLGL